MQERHKWNKIKRNFTPGVVIIDNNAPRKSWIQGRVVQGPKELSVVSWLKPIPTSFKDPSPSSVCSWRQLTEPIKPYPFRLGLGLGLGLGFWVQKPQKQDSWSLTLQQRLPLNSRTMD